MLNTMVFCIVSEQSTDKEALEACTLIVVRDLCVPFFIVTMCLIHLHTLLYDFHTGMLDYTQLRFERHQTVFYTFFYFAFFWSFSSGTEKQITLDVNVAWNDFRTMCSATHNANGGIFYAYGYISLTPPPTKKQNQRKQKQTNKQADKKKKNNNKKKK